MICYDTILYRTIEDIYNVYIEDFYKLYSIFYSSNSPLSTLVL